MRQATIGLCAVLLACGSTVLASEPELDEVPSFDLANVTHELGLWGGGAFSVTPLGGLDEVEADGRRVGVFSIRYGRVLLRREAFALEYVADLIPFAVETNTIIATDEATGTFERKTAYGAGASPLGARIIFRPDSRVRPTASVHGGFLVFDKEVPLPGARRFAWTADGEVGLQIGIAQRSALTLGVRFHHISNAETGRVNPGLNAFVFFAGFSLFR